jgi:hypothetical protein
VYPQHNNNLKKKKYLTLKVKNQIKSENLRKEGRKKQKKSVHRKQVLSWHCPIIPILRKMEERDS